MSVDDPLEAVTGSISDGAPVDWERTESSATDADELASLRALRETERVAVGYRTLHGSPDVTTQRNGEGSAPAGRLGPMQWGDLTVLELARAGANGEVWRAWDPWLQREVALKFLQVQAPPGAGGVGESALLEEARALARVRHPSVVAVHGIAEHDRRVGMWMEFLEGSTLAAEIERRGALPPLEVARIGLALCRALEAVQAAGLVHRDLKPSNVVLESSGRVVLTDFGLGRRWELANRPWGASGTPIFMSPGVLSGEAATPRSDLYALGVTLRWALTGQPPFKARNFEELQIEAKAGPSTSILRERPDAPKALVAVIERAMAPRAQDRFAGAGQMAAALESAIRSIETGRFGHVRTGVAIAASVALLVLGGVSVSRFVSSRPSSPVTRFSVTLPPGMTLGQDPVNLAISPNGLLLAFAASDSTGTNRLWVRPLNSLVARPIAGTDAAQQPFWSPDSRQLAFFAQGKLKKVSLAGGLPEILCAAGDGRGGSWGRTGVIIFAPGTTGPLCCVSSNGGPVSVILQPDPARNETALRWPQFLPDGRHFLFVSLPERRGGGFDICVSTIDSHERRRVLRTGTAPVVAGRDEVVFARDGQLMAQRFDFAKLRPVGDPVPLGPSTASDWSVGEPLAFASWNGVLVHQNAALPNTELLWVDRSGRQRGVLPAPKGRYEKAVFSPDGRRLLLVRRTSPAMVDLWMLDRGTGLLTRLSSRSQSRIGGTPSWSPDGNRVAFSSTRDGPTDIFVRDVSQGGVEEPAYQSSDQFKETDSWSPDGRFLFFEKVDSVTGWDVWILPMEGERRPLPYLHGRAAELWAVLSPDCRWLAYMSTETGTGQIYVQSFPKSGDKHLISITEGLLPAWSSSGRELMFLGSDRLLWSVPVVTTPTFRAGTPRGLFRIPEGALVITPTPDFRRFLAAVPERDAPAPTITVELNWPSEAKRQLHAAWHGRREG